MYHMEWLNYAENVQHDNYLKNQPVIKSNTFIIYTLSVYQKMYQIGREMAIHRGG